MSSEWWKGLRNAVVIVGILVLIGLIANWYVNYVWDGDTRCLITDKCRIIHTTPDNE
jgi:hypothetical protein